MSNSIPTKMAAVLLKGHGGLDMLEYRDEIPVPVPDAEEVLIRVGAAGINNTDVNTRTAWYSKGVTGGTTEGGSAGFTSADDSDGSWSRTPLSFPRIQGADTCGVIVRVGEGVDQARIGERVLVSTMQPIDKENFVTATVGSESDGGFAQYMKTGSVNAHRIDCDLTDIQLASFPCAYSTAENMLHRSGVKDSDKVLITGASGGVGSAAIQLVKRRGGVVIAVAGASKMDEVRAVGADRVVPRGDDLVAALGESSVDVVVDLVGGSQWPQLLDVLKTGGRYATAGAIAGPIVELDLRTLYLKDLTFYGCTFQDYVVFENLVGYIERGEVKPLVAKSYPLRDIVQAQQDFLAKKFTGKLVLVPPHA